MFKNINYISSFFLFLSLLFFSACSNKNIQVEDINKYSQNPNSYLNEELTFNNQQSFNKIFFKNYFNVWDKPTIKINKKQATWGFSYKNKDIYLQNFSKASNEWFNKHIENSNFNEFKKVLKKAITIKNSDIRVFPTNEMMFANPNKAGEGFPFDYNQNSSIKINTPILISHYSKDKAWAYIKTSSFYGWIKIDHIAFVDNTFIKDFKSKNFAFVIKDKINAYDDFFIEKLQLGTVIPYLDNTFYIAKKNNKNMAYLSKSYIHREAISLKPLEFNNYNIKKVANELINEQYGWGGLFGFRDCSSFTQDFFASFGVFIGRNSAEQRKAGKYIKINNLSNKEKKDFIIKNAKPFKTLIYLKGHIMLYIGHKNKEPLVMHNIWGVKTKSFLNTEGRNIIGKNIISSLEIGKELNNYDKKSTILNKIEGIVILDK